MDSLNKEVRNLTEMRQNISDNYNFSDSLSKLVNSANRTVANTYILV